MRTTLDLPDELLKQAEIAAVQRGTSLRELVASALRIELGTADERRSKRLLSAPIRLAEDSPMHTLSPAQLEGIDSEAEAEHLLAVYRRR